MKRTIFCIALSLGTLLGMAQQGGEKPVNGAEIKFESLSYNYGTLKVGDVRDGIYVFKNVGNKPLILDDVKTSCDCTVIEYPKAPTMPGQSDTIRATYTAESPGEINKWITVLSNAQTDRVILKTKGTVE